MFLNFTLPNNGVGYIVDGVMDAQALHYLRDEIIYLFREHERLNIYLEDGGVTYFSFSSMWITTLFPHKHRGKIGMAAMVTDRRWIRIICQCNNWFTKVKIRTFRIAERQQAIEWISGL